MIEKIMKDDADAIIATLAASKASINETVNLIEKGLERQARIFTVGAGASALVAKEIAGQAMEVGIFCYPLTNDLSEAQPISFCKGGYENEGSLAEYYAFLMNKGDILIAISASGETGFVYHLVYLVKYRCNAKVISITENASSNLAKNSDIVILTRGKPEAPSASKSQACQLAVGHAIMLGLADKRHITNDEMIKHMHPSIINSKPMGWK